MTAYNKNDLYNKYVQEQASEAFMNGCIDEEVYSSILQKSAHTLYTPNYFIRIGLALLTAVAIILSLALLWLITSASSDISIIVLLIFFAFVYYGLLELIIRMKQYYNAGIDNILLTAIVLFIVSAFLVNDSDNSYEVISGTTMLVCLLLAIRCTDACMTIIAFTAMVSLFFLLYIKLGAVGRLTVPFALMAVAVVVYLLMKKFVSDQRMIIYRYCIQWVLFLAMILLYAAGNYFVVNELGIEMFDTPILMGWVFWLFTLGIPVIYVFYGLKQRQPLFYRTGLLLMVASVLTVRYYYTVMPAEIAMIVFGILLIVLSYTIIKYFAMPKRGFTFEDTAYKEKGLLNAEALIIAQVFGRKNEMPENPVSFGGGSSGGAGASGDY